MTPERTAAASVPETAVGIDQSGLVRFFAAHVPEAGGTLSAQLIAGGRSNLTYRVTAGDRSWVLRRPPLGSLTQSAHDMTREYRVTAALADSGVPVPRTVALCEDPTVIGAPFSLVEYVAGPVLRTRKDLDAWPAAAVRQAAEALIAAMAQLHAVDPAEVGLADFGRPEGYLARQVRRWRDQWQRGATRELPDLDRLYTLLAEQIPSSSRAAIVHGDVRIDNAILAPDLSAVRALVDWEMATLGDPLADLALVMVYRSELLEPLVGGSAAAADPRMPTPREQAELYASRAGRPLDDLGFQLGLACLKLAVIAEGIHARHLDGLTVGAGFESVGAAVPALAALGLHVLAGGEVSQLANDHGGS
jgi:aminoglycoside phosphotransferase (APT) family kinase protein